MQEDEQEIMPYELTVNSHFSKGKDFPIVEYISMYESVVNLFPIDKEEQMFEILLEIAGSFFMNFNSDKEKERYAEFLKYPALGFTKVMRFRTINPDLVTCIRMHYLTEEKAIIVEEFIQYKEDEIPDKVLDMINETDKENTKLIFKIFHDVPKEG